MGSKSNFFFKIFICNIVLQLFTTSTIIRAAKTVLPFCFQGQLWGGFTSAKKFFWVLPRQKHSSSVFFWNSCSEYIPKIASKKTSTTEFMSFRYALCRKWFSWNFPKIFSAAFSTNTAGGMLLILCNYSLKISRISFNTLTPGGNKRSYILKQTFHQTFRFV